MHIIEHMTAAGGGSRNLLRGRGGGGGRVNYRVKQERCWSPKGAGSQRQGLGVGPGCLAPPPPPPFPMSDYVMHTAIYVAKLLSVSLP